MVKTKKRYCNFMCVLYFVVCVCSHLGTTGFLFQRFSYDNGQRVILVQKTKQKKIRKGNYGGNSKICIMWGQLFSFSPQAYQPSVTPNKPLDLLSLNTPFKGGIGNVLSTPPGANALMFSGYAEKVLENMGKGLEMTVLGTRITFSILKSHSEAKAFTLNE